MIEYGGTKKQVEKQLQCKHGSWYGPCIDYISRYYKFLDCYCLERDCTDDEYINQRIDSVTCDYFTCNDCDDKDTCQFAFDMYNTNGDCLESK